MCYKRTKFWYGKTQPDFEQGGVVLVVGGGHVFVPKHGYVDRLKEDGFSVERV
jgi:uncharacterized protein YbaP (TraB family)